MSYTPNSILTKVPNMKQFYYFNKHYGHLNQCSKFQNTKQPNLADMVSLSGSSMEIFSSHKQTSSVGIQKKPFRGLITTY